MNPFKSSLRRLSISSYDMQFTKNFVMWGALWGAFGAFSTLDPLVITVAAAANATVWGLGGVGLDLIKVLHGRRSRLNGLERPILPPPLSWPVLPLRRVPVAAAIMYVGGNLLGNALAPHEPNTGFWLGNLAVQSVTQGFAYAVGAIAGSEWLYATKSKYWHGVV